MRPRRMRHAPEAQRFPKRRCPCDAGVDGQQVVRAERVFHHSGGERTTHAASAPRRMHVKPSHPHGALAIGRVDLDCRATDAYEDATGHHREEYFATLVEAFCAASPVRNEPVDIRYVLGCGFRRQSFDAGGKAVLYALEAQQAVAQSFNR